jgi:hypothetical protein
MKRLQIGLTTVATSLIGILVINVLHLSESSSSCIEACNGSDSANAFFSTLNLFFMILFLASVIGTLFSMFARNLSDRISIITLVGTIITLFFGFYERHGQGLTFSGLILAPLLFFLLIVDITFYVLTIRKLKWGLSDNYKFTKILFWLVIACLVGGMILLGVISAVLDR